MNRVPVDVIKELVSFVDITGGDHAIHAFGLSENEKEQVLKWWKSNTQYTTIVDGNMTITLVNGKRHSIDDKPTVVYDTSYKYWMNRGYFHRDNGHAVELANETKKWYKMGLLHRVDGPAIESIDGSPEWYLDGKFHRLDGPAYTDYVGNSYWYLHGQLHRIDGPAIETTNGVSEWWRNGKLFRIDYPANYFVVLDISMSDEFNANKNNTNIRGE
jgi:hypothetical protein